MRSFFHLLRPSGSRRYRMMSLVLNLVIIATAVTFGATVANGSSGLSLSNLRYWINTAHRGMRLDIPDIDWKASERTLVLALDHGCKYCIESSGFYRRLSDEFGKTVPIIVIGRDEPSALREFLAQNKITVNQLRHVEWNKVGIAGTPTILVVNKWGRVSSVWLGKLTNEQQDEVRHALM